MPASIVAPALAVTVVGGLTLLVSGIGQSTLLLIRDVVMELAVGSNVSSTADNWGAQSSNETYSPRLSDDEIERELLRLSQENNYDSTTQVVYFMDRTR